MNNGEKDVSIGEIDETDELLSEYLDNWDANIDEVLALAKKFGLNVELPDGEDA